MAERNAETELGSGRVEAFSDAVFAVIITITGRELRARARNLRLERDEPLHRLEQGRPAPPKKHLTLEQRAVQRAFYQNARQGHPGPIPMDANPLARVHARARDQGDELHCHATNRTRSARSRRARGS